MVNKALEIRPQLNFLSVSTGPMPTKNLAINEDGDSIASMLIELDSNSWTDNSPQLKTGG